MPHYSLFGILCLWLLRGFLTLRDLMSVPGDKVSPWEVTFKELVPQVDSLLYLLRC